MATNPSVAVAPERTLLDIVRLSTTYLAQRGAGSARLDAELLCAHALGLRRIDLYLQFDRRLSGAEVARMRELLRRRARHEPVAYITGEREFYGRSFLVNRDVLIPRPDTETLVEAALQRLRARDGASLRVADPGTGSGCIAVTLACELRGIDVHASDISAGAVATATANALRHGVAGHVRVCQGAWLEPLAGTFDMVVSNPPYVTTAELAAAGDDVRDHEPAAALLGGDDGLDAYHALLDSLRGRVAPGGDVVLEVDPRRAAAVTSLLLGEFPDADVATIADLTGRTRVVAASVLR